MKRPRRQGQSASLGMLLPCRRSMWAVTSSTTLSLTGYSVVVPSPSMGYVDCLEKHGGSPQTAYFGQPRGSPGYFKYVSEKACRRSAPKLSMSHTAREKARQATHGRCVAFA